MRVPKRNKMVRDRMSQGAVKFDRSLARLQIDLKNTYFAVPVSEEDREYLSEVQIHTLSYISTLVGQTRASVVVYIPV